ncbi:MAG: hypothetical protein SPH60_07170, partial [Alistipes senegalensis]|nr:hypothetical protein [Alistipes senegalensis]
RKSNHFFRNGLISGPIRRFFYQQNVNAPPQPADNAPEAPREPFGGSGRAKKYLFMGIAGYVRRA